MSQINALLGKTLTKIEVIKDEKIKFTTDQGEVYWMYHRQDCCESVTIEDIAGNLDLLVGSPILLAEERTECDDAAYITWTFYEIGNVNERVTIRWYGTSNGYYSEEVSFEKMPEPYGIF